MFTFCNQINEIISDVTMIMKQGKRERDRERERGKGKEEKEENEEEPVHCYS